MCWFHLFLFISFYWELYQYSSHGDDDLCMLVYPDQDIIIMIFIMIVVTITGIFMAIN